jgi:hypothetical protein
MMCCKRFRCENLQKLFIIVFSLSVILLKVYAQEDSDSVPCSRSLDTSTETEMQEDKFQNDINALFTPSPFDTFAWNIRKINSGHFDSENWADTARIVLVDSLKNKFYCHPFNNCVTSDFGPRKWLWHYGVDIKLLKGDSVRAAFDGVVRVRGFDKHGYGIVIVLRHDHGLETIYGHLSKAFLKSNQSIKAGDVIGLGGNTGRSTGSHLHFEMRFCGEPFNPNDIIDFQNYALKNDTLILTKADFAYLCEARKTIWHSVKKGETLGQIAASYHTTISALCRLNHITSKTILSVGRRIAISGNNRSDPKVSLQKAVQKPES